MHNLTVQKICLGLVALAFFITAPWITSELLQGNAMPLVTVAGAGAMILFVYGLGDRCWLIVPFCLSIEGNLNFLPLGFSIQELSVFVVLGYLMLKIIFGQNFAWKIGPAMFWLPLSGLLAVIFYHWISSGDIGIRLLGGAGWGGRKYFKVAMAALTLPVLASFPGIKWQDLQKVPMIYFLGSFIDIVPDTLTTLFPATAPILWKFYSSVNLAEYGQTLRGSFSGEEGVTRIGNLSKVGSALALVVICYVPAYSWLNPRKLWALPVVMLGGISCGLSGFRNSVFRFAVSLFAGLYSWIRWRAFLILPLGVGLALIISFTQGTVFNYPLALQRALSFLPGNWNAKATRDASGSSEWREKMKTLYYAEYFPKQPIFGYGYHYDPELAMRDTDIYLSIAAKRAAAGDEFADVRSFIEQRMPHDGPVHALLISGIVGTVCFTVFCLSLLIYTIGSIQKTPTRAVSPIQVWAISLVLPNTLGFFVVFGEYSTFLMQTIPVAILLFRADRLRALGEFGSSPAPSYRNAADISPLV